MTLQNTVTTGRGVEGMRDEWLTWCSNTDGQLRNLFAVQDLADELFRAQLEVQPLGEHGSPYILIGTLNGVCKAKLDEVVADLKRRRTFVTRPGFLGVLDTSALVERDLFNADWRQVMGVAATDQVRLIAPIVVIEELDELKRHRNPDIMARARRVLRGLRVFPTLNEGARVPLVTVLRSRCCWTNDGMLGYTLTMTR